MEAVSRTRSIGGSLVVTIPREIVKEESISAGELVTIKIEKVRKDGFGCLKGISSFTKEDELDIE